MTLRIQAAAFGFAATAVLCPAIAAAACGIGPNCPIDHNVPTRPAHIVEAAAVSSASTSAPTPLVEVGQILPRGEHSVIINAEYYGLPAVADGWIYVRVGQDAYRVDRQTHEVLERVTEQAAANF